MIFYLCGMHGSGTSLASRYLHHCEVNMTGSDPIDRLGENKKFRRMQRRDILAIIPEEELSKVQFV